MTTDDKNGIPDEEFEAFLKGEDELSRRLKALPQPSPSAEQDAAILKRVKFALAQEGRPAAANDAAPMGFNRRWRVPVGIAAALVAGVLTHQSWRAGSDVEKLAEIPYSPPPAAEKPAPAQAPEMKADAPQAAAKATPDGRQPRMQIAAPPPPPPPVRTPAPAQPAPPPVATPAAPVAPAPELSAQGTQQPVMRYAPAADSRAAAPRADGSLGVSVTGSRNRAELRKSTAADKSAPQAWLELIDEMLKAGLPRDALDEWTKFRQAYPDYPVPEPLADRIKAIRR